MLYFPNPHVFPFIYGDQEQAKKVLEFLIHQHQDLQRGDFSASGQIGVRELLCK